MNNDVENHMVLPLAEPVIEPDGDPTDDDREEWIKDREECLRTMLKTRISAAIKRISNHGSFDTEELVKLLKDCKREIA